MSSAAKLKEIWMERFDTKRANLDAVLKRSERYGFALYRSLESGADDCRNAMARYNRLEPAISSMFLNQRCYQAISLWVALYVVPIIHSSSIPHEPAQQVVDAMCALADVYTNIRHKFPDGGPWEDTDTTPEIAGDPPLDGPAAVCVDAAADWKFSPGVTRYSN